MAKSILDGIIFKIDNGYPLLQEEYKLLLTGMNVLEEQEYIGEWYNGRITFENVNKTYYVVGDSEKGYFEFWHYEREWVVNEYFEAKRVQRKSKQVVETKVWYE